MVVSVMTGHACRAVCDAFGLPEVQRLRQQGQGRIHATFRLAFAQRNPIILQAVNTDVFPHIDNIADNIARISAYLRRHGRQPHVLEPVALHQRPEQWLFKSAAGRVWRCFEFVGDTYTLQATDDANVMRAAVAAFGAFVVDLADFDAASLRVTLPGFHDTPDRAASFERAVRADVAGRRRACADLIAGLRAYRGLARAIRRQPRRVVHNDTKLNNLLFHRRTHSPWCVVDWDTVMPGWLAHDFGDAVRALCSPRGEAAVFDPERVNVSERFSAALDGLLSVARPIMQPAECEVLALAPLVMSYELALRFLTDYLQGDRYFAARAPDDNLNCARNQFALLAAMREQYPELARRAQRATGVAALPLPH